jgi:DNA-binding FadR family transcriptional regulator
VLGGRRASAAILRELAARIDAFEAGPASAHAWGELEERYWVTLARASGNRLYEFDMNWWFKWTADHPRLRALNPAPIAARVLFLKELTRRLIAGEDAARLYLDTLEPLLMSGEQSAAVPAADHAARHGRSST